MKRLLFREFVLDGGGNQFFPGLAQFHALGQQVGVKQCDQDSKPEPQSPGDSEFHMKAVLTEIKGRKQNREKPRAQEYTGE